jgi:hypothetical protein
VAEPEPFDPIGILRALDRHRVTYVLIGALGRVVQGAEEVTDGLDFVPSTRPENIRKLGLALQDLQATPAAGGEVDLEARLGREEVIELQSELGEMKIVPVPAGTRGYEDLRRAASREPLGSGVRPAVASVGDLARMVAALGREEDIPRLLALRRLSELERQLGVEL